MILIDWVFFTKLSDNTNVFLKKDPILNFDDFSFKLKWKHITLCYKMKYKIYIHAMICNWIS